MSNTKANAKPKGQDLIDPAKTITNAEFNALIATSTLSRGAVTTQQYMAGMLGQTATWIDHLDAVTRQCERLEENNVSLVESMLLTQANTLDAMFNSFACRAQQNVGHHLNAVESYARLALKAQAQSRATLQTLAEIKNPRPVAFVKQANIAHGPQQVNNASAPPEPHNDARACAENSARTTNELLESDDGERLEFETTSQASRSNQTVETVGNRQRTGNGQR